MLRMADGEQPVAKFEGSLEELEKIVRELEAGDLPLERSLELLERGVGLSEQCRKQEDAAIDGNFHPALGDQHLVHVGGPFRVAMLRPPFAR